MDPQIYGVLGAAMAVGLAGGKLIDNLWAYYHNGRKNRNGKMEMLLQRLVDLAEEARKQSTDQGEVQRLVLREMEQHAARASKDHEEFFKLLRKE